MDKKEENRMYMSKYININEINMPKKSKKDTKITECNHFYESCLIKESLKDNKHSVIWFEGKYCTQCGHIIYCRWLKNKPIMINKKLIIEVEVD